MQGSHWEGIFLEGVRARLVLRGGRGFLHPPSPRAQAGKGPQGDRLRLPALGCTPWPGCLAIGLYLGQRSPGALSLCCVHFQTLQPRNFHSGSGALRTLSTESWGLSPGSAQVGPLGPWPVTVTCSLSVLFQADGSWDVSPAESGKEAAHRPEAEDWAQGERRVRPRSLTGGPSAGPSAHTLCLPYTKTRALSCLDTGSEARLTTPAPAPQDVALGLGDLWSQVPSSRTAHSS